MAGYMYLGSQKVCPAVLLGGGYRELPIYQVVDGVASTKSCELKGDEFSNITSISDCLFFGTFGNISYKIGDSITPPGLRKFDLRGKVDLSSLTTVGGLGLSYTFYDNEGITGVDLSSLTTVGGGGLEYAFYKCSISGSLDLSSLTTVDGYGLQYAFYGCKVSGALDLSSLTSLGTYGLNNAFYDNSITSLDISSLLTIPSYGLAGSFNKCTQLKTVNLSSVTSVGSYGMAGAFYRCSNLESVDLSSLTTIIGGGRRISSAFEGAFADTPISRMDFPLLNSIGQQYCFDLAFAVCPKLKDIYFNSLTTTSFGSYTSQFAIMFNSETAEESGGVTVHFPSNLESTIQGLDGYPNFNGASGYVTLAFDLPATS